MMNDDDALAAYLATFRGDDEPGEKRIGDFVVDLSGSMLNSAVRRYALACAHAEDDLIAYLTILEAQTWQIAALLAHARKRAETSVEDAPYLNELLRLRRAAAGGMKLQEMMERFIDRQI